jgi:hypothetical protein
MSVRSFYDGRPIDGLDDAEKDNHNDQPPTLQVPAHCGRHRSVSTGDIETLGTALKQGLNIAAH